MLLLLNLSRKQAETIESRDPGSCHIKAEGPSETVLPSPELCTLAGLLAGTGW